MLVEEIILILSDLHILTKCGDSNRDFLWGLMILCHLGCQDAHKYPDLAPAAEQIHTRYWKSPDARYGHEYLWLVSHLSVCNIMHSKCVVNVVSNITETPFIHMEQSKWIILHYFQILTLTTESLPRTIFDMHIKKDITSKANKILKIKCAENNL